MPTPVQLIVFEKDLAKNIFPDNSYIRRSRNDDSMVNAGSVVLPQSGTVPNVQLNRVGQSSLTERIDSVLTYNINEFTSDATLIRDFDALTVNYAKREDVLRDHREQLYKTVCNYTNYQWMLGSAMMRTTGGNRTIGIAPGATGTRKLITLADIKNAKARLDKQDIPSDGRC